VYHFGVSRYNITLIVSCFALFLTYQVAFLPYLSSASHSTQNELLWLSYIYLVYADTKLPILFKKERERGKETDILKSIHRKKIVSIFAPSLSKNPLSRGFSKFSLIERIRSVSLTSCQVHLDARSYKKLSVRATVADVSLSTMQKPIVGTSCKRMQVYRLHLDPI